MDPEFTSLEEDIEKSFLEAEDDSVTSNAFMEDYDKLEAGEDISSKQEDEQEPGQAESKEDPAPDWRKLYEETAAKQADLEEKMQLLYNGQLQQRQQVQQVQQPQYQQQQAPGVDPNYILTYGDLEQQLAPFRQGFQNLQQHLAYESYRNERSKADAAIAEMKARYANEQIKFEDAIDPKELSVAIETQLRQGKRDVAWDKLLDTAYRSKAFDLYKSNYDDLAKQRQKNKAVATKNAAAVPPSTGAQIREPVTPVNPYEKGYGSTKKAFMNDLASLY